MASRHTAGIFYDPREPPPPGLNAHNLSVPAVEISNITRSSTAWRPASAARSERSLPLLAISFESQIIHNTNKVTVTQTFSNNSGDPIPRARYTFPIYDNSTVTGFTCRVGNRMVIRGVVKPRNEANSVFNEAVSEQQTATLLERNTSEIFTTTLGNIPADTIVKVRIIYITVLKYDSASGTITLTIPTSIAPRYGAPPTGYPGTHQEVEIRRRGLRICIGVIASAHIQRIRSPTHPVSVEIGTNGPASRSWADLASNDGPDPKRAYVTLSDRSASLGNDFVLTVKTADPAEVPQALLETHSTFSNHKALMITLPSYATLQSVPQSPVTEIIFVADRSGSMADKMETLKFALEFFLKSIPPGHRFNIWSFGSSYSSLWGYSMPYSQENLMAAMNHVQRQFRADMGGTELLPALQAIINARATDYTMEVITLTDGEIWRQEETIEFVRQTRDRSEGKVRFFSLGVGNAVSHKLVEGIAREGGGYAEVVSVGGGGGWEDRVVTMLKAALTVHLGPPRIDFSRANDINFGDIVPDSRPQRHEIERPDFLRAPFNISAINPFIRNIVFVLSETDSPMPFGESIKVTATKPDGEPLIFSLSVTSLEQPGSTIHKLGARALMSDLESSQSWIHLGRYGALRDNNPAQFDDLVRSEGERLGCKWSIAGKWTSFVAVERMRRLNHSPRGAEQLALTREDRELDLLLPQGTPAPLRIEEASASGYLSNENSTSDSDWSDTSSDSGSDVVSPIRGYYPPDDPPGGGMGGNPNSAPNPGMGSSRDLADSQSYPAHSTNSAFGYHQPNPGLGSSRDLASSQSYPALSGESASSYYQPNPGSGSSQDLAGSQSYLAPLKQSASSHYQPNPGLGSSQDLAGLAPLKPSGLSYYQPNPGLGPSQDLACSQSYPTYFTGLDLISEDELDWAAGLSSPPPQMAPSPLTPLQAFLGGPSSTPISADNACPKRKVGPILHGEDVRKKQSYTQELSPMSVPYHNPSDSNALEIIDTNHKSVEDMKNEHAIREIVSSQEYNGAFIISLPSVIKELLGTTVEERINSLTSVDIRWILIAQHIAVCTTILVIVLFEEKFQSQKLLWELVVQKAKTYVEGEVQNYEDRERLYGHARSLIQTTGSTTAEQNSSTEHQVSSTSSPAARGSRKRKRPSGGRKKKTPHTRATQLRRQPSPISTGAPSQCSNVKIVI